MSSSHSYVQKMNDVPESRWLSHLMALTFVVGTCGEVGLSLFSDRKS